MSRCFPYPPPGYEKNGIRDGALIESIKKLQREGEKAKKEKKEKKREKEKHKSRGSGESENKKHRHKKDKRHKNEKDQEGQKILEQEKKRKLETENLEKSILTEEHGQPVGSQNSSDSTLNSNNKRHKPSSPLESCHDSGSIIRIRLPSQRHKDPEMFLPSKEQPFPASGRTGDKALIHMPCETALKQGREPVDQQQQPCSTSRNASQVGKNFMLTKDEQNRSSKSAGISHRAATVSLPSKEEQNPSSKSAVISHRASTSPVSNKEKQISSSRSGDVSNMVESLPKTSKSSSRKTLSIVSQFNDLFENWVPPPLQVDSIDPGDEKWLFEAKQDPNHKVETRKPDRDVTAYGPSSVWPRASLLPAADIFALPYAVPF